MTARAMSGQNNKTVKSTTGEKSVGKQVNTEKSTTETSTSEPKIIDVALAKHLSEPFDYPQMHIFVNILRIVFLIQKVKF